MPRIAIQDDSGLFPFVVEREDGPYEVSEETLARWKRVKADFDQMLKEIEALEGSRKPVCPLCETHEHSPYACDIGS